MQINNLYSDKPNRKPIENRQIKRKPRFGLNRTRIESNQPKPSRNPLSFYLHAHPLPSPSPFSATPPAAPPRHHCHLLLFYSSSLLFFFLLSFLFFLFLPCACDSTTGRSGSRLHQLERSRRAQAPLLRRSSSRHASSGAPPSARSCSAQQPLTQHDLHQTSAATPQPVAATAVAPARLR